MLLIERTVAVGQNDLFGDIVLVYVCRKRTKLSILGSDVAGSSLSVLILCMSVFFSSCLSSLPLCGRFSVRV